MRGIELVKHCGTHVDHAADNGWLISVTGETVSCLGQSLIMKREEAEEVVAILGTLIKELLQEGSSA